MDTKEKTLRKSLQKANELSNKVKEIINYQKKIDSMFALKTLQDKNADLEIRLTVDISLSLIRYAYFYTRKYGQWQCKKVKWSSSVMKPLYKEENFSLIQTSENFNKKINQWQISSSQSLIFQKCEEYESGKFNVDDGVYYNIIIITPKNHLVYHYHSPDLFVERCPHFAKLMEFINLLENE